MHGGSITASSPGLGQGSEFVVRLPVPADLSPPPVTTVVDVAVTTVAGPRRVLVVDDHKDSALQPFAGLAPLGPRRSRRPRGAAAIEEVATHPV